MRNTCRFWLPVFVVALATITVNAQSFRVQCPVSTVTHPNAAANNSEPTYSAPTAVPFMTISSISESGSTVTVTATGPGQFPGLVTNLNIGIVDVSPAGYNGFFRITSVISNNYDPSTGLTTATFRYTGSRGLTAGTGGYLTSNANGAIKCQQISGGDGYATMGDGTQTYMFSFGPLSGLADIKKGLPGTEFASVFNVVGTAADPNYNGAIGLVPDPESTPPGQLTGHVDPRQIMDVGVMNGNMPAPT